jgi:hypothetical protein
VKEFKERPSYDPTTEQRSLVASAPCGYPFKFSTEVSVTPNTFPYKWADARPITAPDGR